MNLLKNPPGEGLIYAPDGDTGTVAWLIAIFVVVFLLVIRDGRKK